MRISLYKHYKILTLVTAALFAIGIDAKGDDSKERRPALPFPPGITVESQCGLVNEQQDVEFYDGSLGVTHSYVEKHEPSTVLFQWKGVREILKKLPGYRPGNVASKRWCSGTLISENLVLTAGHCFDKQYGQHNWITPHTFDDDGQPQYAEPKILATLQQVHFKFQLDGETGALRTPKTFNIADLVEYRLNGLDYAIVRLEADENGKSAAEYFSPESVLTRNPATGEPITIIQHPQGLPKKIDTGNIEGMTNEYLRYGNLDTHSGSSGSGVRDESGRVIGVHTNGGCGISSGTNSGVRNSAISAVSGIL